MLRCRYGLGRIRFNPSVVPRKNPNHKFIAPVSREAGAQTTGQANDPTCTWNGSVAGSLCTAWPVSITGPTWQAKAADSKSSHINKGLFTWQVTLSPEASCQDGRRRLPTGRQQLHWPWALFTATFRSPSILRSLNAYHLRT